VNNEKGQEESGNKWALITGASAGLGVDFAHVFAEHGFNLVLVARREDRLKKLSEEIVSMHACQCKVITSDLAQASAPSDIVARLNDDNINIDVLVNNAGFAVPKKFSEADWQQHADMIQVLSTSVLHLTHLLVRGMKERKYGRILNVSSLGAFTPDISGNIYDAIKIFILRATITLDLELRPHGIFCTALCPGMTRTEFHKSMGSNEEETLPAYMWTDSRPVAERGYEALMKGQVYCLYGRFNRFAAFMSGLMPLRMHIFISRLSGL